MRIARPFKKSNLLYIPEAQLAWRHDYDIDDGLTTASFDGFPAMTVTLQGGDIRIENRPAQGAILLHTFTW